MPWYVSIGAFFLFVWLAQALDDGGYLARREAAGTGIVALLTQAVVKAGVAVDPPLELLPSGLRRNVWAVGQGKLRSAVFLYLELHPGAYRLQRYAKNGQKPCLAHRP